MPSSSPSPDKFQREIDDVIRLAEHRLERQSLGNRVRRRTRRLGIGRPRLSIPWPSAELLAGWGLALLLASWLLGLLAGLLRLPGFSLLVFFAQAVGIALLVAGLVTSLLHGRFSGKGGGGTKMWRGERISYGSYNARGGRLVDRVRRMLGIRS